MVTKCHSFPTGSLSRVLLGCSFCWALWLVLKLPWPSSWKFNIVSPLQTGKERKRCWKRTNHSTLGQMEDFLFYFSHWLVAACFCVPSLLNMCVCVWGCWMCMCMSRLEVDVLCLSLPFSPLILRQNLYFYEHGVHALKDWLVSKLWRSNWSTSLAMRL